MYSKERFNGVSGSVESMFPYLGWGSIASDWLFYETDRVSVPRPWIAGTLTLLQSDLYMPRKMQEMMKRAPKDQLVHVLTNPGILMSEIVTENFTLGSGWLIVGLQKNERGEFLLNSSCSLKKIRFMEYRLNGLVNLLLTFEDSPDSVVFTHIMELDGRTNVAHHGKLNPITRYGTVLSSNVDSKNCMACQEFGRICNCESEEINKHFRDELALRRSVCDVSSRSSSIGNAYFGRWIRGLWTLRIQSKMPIPPFQIHMRSIQEGQTFLDSLTFVIQDEVLSVHPPRATNSLVHALQKTISNWSSIENEMGDSDYYKNSQKGFAPLSGFKQRLSDETDGGSHDNEAQEPIESLLASQCTSRPNFSSSKDLKVCSNESSAPGKDTTTFECEECGMKFRRRYDCRRHVRTVHEKRRDFQCEICAKKFTQKGHLSEHTKFVHEGTRSHPCQLCTKVFYVKSKLDRHMKGVHENLRPYECEHCESSFKDRSYLKQHIQKIHESRVEIQPTV